MKRIKILIVSLLISLTGITQHKITPASPEYYAMDREDIHFDDQQVLLVNYRGFVSPQQYSVTQFTNVQFEPIEAHKYQFNLNFYDKDTKRLIEDDVPTKWKSWIDDGKSYDPLGSNFRPNSPSIMVTQDEKWQPNQYYRSATFHKEYNNTWVSFGAKSWTSVANNDDEVFIKLQLSNRNSKNLEMTLIPNQIAEHLYCSFREGNTTAKQIDAFTIGSEVAHARVSSSIKEISDKGFEISIPAGKTKTYFFAIKFYQPDQSEPAIVQNDIKERMEVADQKTREMLAWAYNQLPQLSSANQELVEYYYRCMLSVMMCRYENPNYITDVFWAVGTWPFTISWDNSYSSDVLAMLEPESLKGAILTDFEHVKMKRTYVGWNGAFWDNLYIQEPFALQVMIEAYLRHTNDYSLFTTKASGKSVWEWMQGWVNELENNYTNDLGLIDVGYNTEKIIEIRTDGYNHVVPITNTLTIDLLYTMAEWAERLGDKKLQAKYFKNAKKLETLVDKHLWNQELAWFDNLYPDGSKTSIWTYHLFDMLGADYLSDQQSYGLVSHLQEGEFLGKFGVYSIARRDSVHWDLIDSDWGGGGQYAGMPGRISRNLYQKGFAGKGWDVLKRNIRYIEYFPYLPQNPRIDTPEQDRSSMPVQIAAGAGMEAVIFGTFGINIEGDTLSIKPFNHEDIGEAILSNIKFKGRTFGIQLNRKTFLVYENDKLIATKFYGESFLIK
ncbi:MGH1-like glycoside hydrolase domain-containing protein [Marinifilum caeruleilacunae]|jgi:hypothetical protein|uniref:Mannosylglycerate hydrolase MGH1-like glycoside hydrolase domain-containing protein n=1 Tax=Marinifilum caeruleilacunae TaxID=2499076 RepID=A0ABX1WVD1_9BACT|nr:hypothetical protein [Marinifilum caeruleilacunae]NOU59873.1 hypothetical protein [Marinifilum caeruleilacunae]